MKSVKVLNSLLVFVLFGAGLTAVASNKNFNSASALSTNVDNAVETDYGFDPNAGEAESFKVSIQQSTSTATSHSFALKFMSSINTVSTTLSTFDNKLKGVYITTDDANCPSDKEIKDLTKYDFDPANPDYKLVECDEEGNPVLTEDGEYTFIPDKDGVTHDYAFKIPTFDGYVYRIESSDRQETVIIPQYITRQDRYRIRVTAIGQNVFNYRKQSNGTEKDTIKKVTNLIIGPNITAFADNAFIGIETELANLNINICGSAEGRTFGENWDPSNSAVFNYDLSTSGLSATDITTLKKIYSLDVVKDNDGNPCYYDNNGYRIDENGNYLDENGNIDDSKEPTTDAPLTNIAARVLSYTNTVKYSSKTIVFGDEESNRPMILEYKVTDKNGVTSTQYYEFPFVESEGGVGSIAGKPDLIKYVDFHINNGETIDSTSLVIHNLFENASSNELHADLNVEYQCRPEKGYKNVLNINEFISSRLKAVRSFGKYTAFILNVDKVDGIYEKLNPSSYSQFKGKIKTGEINIRYQFNSFNNSTYRITFMKNGELCTKEVSFNKSSEKGLTLNFHLLTKNKNNSVTFLIKNSLVDEDFNASSIRRLEYKAVYFKVDLMNSKKGTTQVVTKSEVVTRFGYFDILPESSKPVKSFSADTFLIIALISFVALYVACATGYYIYAKNKYKNDEFRRMNTKKYLKSALIGFIGAFFITFMILFIVLRFSLFNVSVIVYNPLDPLVMIFGIIGLVTTGLFIKKLVVTIKANKERANAIRLKLNEDVADDGTK